MKLSALGLLWATQATASTTGSFTDYMPKFTGTFRQNAKPFEALTVGRGLLCHTTSTDVSNV